MFVVLIHFLAEFVQAKIAKFYSVGCYSLEKKFQTEHTPYAHVANVLFIKAIYWQ